MNKQCLYLTMLFLVFLISCKKTKNVDSFNDSNDIKNIKVNITKGSIEVDFNEYFASSRIIPLETNDLSIFSKIDRISFYDNKIFILDRKLNGIFIFDSNGNFLNKIQTVGKGPKEYNSLMDFTVDEKNKNIILYTDRPYKLFIYDLQGVYIKQERLNELYHNIVSVDDKVVLLNRDEDKNYFLFNYDLNSSKIEKGVLEMNAKDVTYRREGINKSFLTKDKNAHLCFPYSETIYEDNGNDIRAKYYIDFGKQTIPNNIYKQKKKLRELINYANKNNYGYGICDFRENDNYITFNYQINKLVIYSKKEKSSKIVSIINNSDMIYGNYIAHDGNDNKFVSTYSAEALKKQMTIYKEKDETWNKVPDYIKQISENITEYSNPLLIVYTFKD